MDGKNANRMETTSIDDDDAGDLAFPKIQLWHYWVVIYIRLLVCLSVIEIDFRVRTFHANQPQIP